MTGKMPHFVWTEGMSVGVPALDQDHKCMVRIINLLEGVHKREETRRTIQTVLDTLRLYGRFHFRREERVMEAVRFPGAAFHRAEHQGFARYIELLRNRYAEGGDPGLARELSEYLTGWLRHHILIQDMAYKPYVMDRITADEMARDAAPILPNFVELAS
jgi:hemerythrin-like metal-binding protein